jgi:hypothetical protein
MTKSISALAETGGGYLLAMHLLCHLVCNLHGLFDYSRTTRRRSFWAFTVIEGGGDHETYG